MVYLYASRPIVYPYTSPPIVYLYACPPIVCLHKLSIWLSCGTMLTGGMHDGSSLTPSVQMNSPHFITDDASSSMNMRHYFEGFCSESTSLSLCCHALACMANNVATLWASTTEYYVSHSDWLRLLG